MPKFSIIIPSYNRANILPRAIQSVFDQTIEDWELILVDDGSTDDTREILSEFIKKPNFSYFYQENSGVSQARNFGADHSNGKWLIFLDSDDELIPSALFQFEKHILANSSIDLFVAGSELKSKTKSVIRIPKEGIYSAMLAGTFCLRKTIFQKVDGYDPRFNFAENTELFYRIDQQDISKFIVPSVSLIYHDSFSGGSKNRENIINSVSLFLSKHQGVMSNHHRHLYHQIIGVNQLRLQRFGEARIQLWKAYQIKPTQFKTLVRLGLTFFPILSKKIYT
jgi:glycosyltransferase involved in cell wall biosynthesis